LAPEKVDFAVEVLHSHLEVLVVVDELDILILVSEDVTLLVLEVASERLALAVPEVDLVAVLSSALLQEGKLGLQVLPRELCVSEGGLKLADALAEGTLVGVVGGTDLTHALLVAAEFLLLFAHLVEPLLQAPALK
jgi:hypothetical protein